MASGVFPCRAFPRPGHPVPASPMPLTIHGEAHRGLPPTTQHPWSSGIRAGSFRALFGHPGKVPLLSLLNEQPPHVSQAAALQQVPLFWPVTSHERHPHPAAIQASF